MSLDKNGAQYLLDMSLDKNGAQYLLDMSLDKNGAQYLLDMSLDKNGAHYLLDMSLDAAQRAMFPVQRQIISYRKHSSLTSIFLHTRKSVGEI